MKYPHAVKVDALLETLDNIVQELQKAVGFFDQSVWALLEEHAADPASDDIPEMLIEAGKDSQEIARLFTMAQAALADVAKEIIA